MKKSILAIAIAAIFASCSNNKPAEQPTAATPAVSSQDTIGLSDYKEWKQKQELQSTQQTYTSPGVTEIAPPAEEVKPEKPVVIYRDAPVRHTRVEKTSKPIKSSVYKAPEETEKPGIAKSPAPENTGGKREPYGRGTSTGTSTDASTSGEAGTSNEEDKPVASTPSEAPAKKDGGWSKPAKDAAIGGASGAVIGAIFSKNKAKGAVIGGVVGAAGGYIFGRNKEKKEAKN